MDARSGSGAFDEPSGSALARVSAELVALQDVVRMACHDLNNPLQTITLLLELLELDVTDEAARERVAHCVEGTQVMRGLVRMLSDFARDAPASEGGATVAETVGRALSVAGRRLERQQVEVHVALGALAEHRMSSDVDGPALRAALLSTLLGMIDVASRSSAARHQLTIRSGSGELELELAPDNGDMDAEAITPEFARRVIDACAGSGLAATVEASSVRFAFSSS